MPQIELDGMKQMDSRTTFEVPSGKRFTIETSPAGKEILDAEVPEGRKWEVSLSISVKETKA